MEVGFFTLPDLIGKGVCFITGHWWTTSSGGVIYCANCGLRK